jgi:hypothetical protein
LMMSGPPLRLDMGGVPVGTWAKVGTSQAKTSKRSKHSRKPLLVIAYSPESLCKEGSFGQTRIDIGRLNGYVEKERSIQ